MSATGTRYVGRILTAGRRRAHAERYSANKGVDDPEALEIVNDGLEEVFTEIAKVNSDLFLTKEFISLVAGTSEYAKPTRLLHGGRIENVKFSPTGVWTSEGYTHDVSGPISDDQRSLYTGNPSNYGFIDNMIFFSPVPQSTVVNGIRCVFRQEPVRLDIRRGVVHADTALNSGASTITTLKIDTAGTPTPNVVDADGNLLEDYVNLVDPYGTFYMRNIPVSAYNTSTGVFTVRSGFTYQAGETAPAGAFLCMGHNATTHNPYDKALDSFLIDYLALNLLQADVDSNSFAMQEKRVARRMGQIKDMFSSVGLTEDYIYIPGQLGD